MTGNLGLDDYDEHRTHIVWGRVAAIIVIVLVALVISNAVMAQVLLQTGAVVCYPTDKVAPALLKDSGEQPILQGVTVMGQVFELYARPDRSTWTAVLVLDNWSCTIAAGSNLELMGEPS